MVQGLSRGFEEMDVDGSEFEPTVGPHRCEWDSGVKGPLGFV